MDTKCLHSFKKSATEEVRISAREYKNKHYFDIRVFFQPVNSGDDVEMQPSKKGVTLPIDLLGEVEKGVLLTKKYQRRVNAELPA